MLLWRHITVKLQMKNNNTNNNFFLIFKTINETRCKTNINIKKIIIKIYKKK